MDKEAKTTALPSADHHEEITPFVDTTHKDKALEFLKAADGPVQYDEETNKRVLRKIDLIILPLMVGCYFVQSVDKASLSYASVFDLITAEHLVGKQYSWTSSIVYFAQLIWQPLTAYFLVRFPLGKFIAVNAFFWGASLAVMAATHNFAGLMVTRFFLGTFEATIGPSFIAVTQMWWRRREQTNRIAIWYCTTGFSSMLGSLMTWGLGHIHSPLYSYQVMFLFFGLLTVAFSVLVLAFMPDTPMKSKFLNDNDKLVAVDRVRMNQMGISSEEWKWSQVKEAFVDPKTWFWMAIIFCVSIISGGISTFGPLVVKAFGFDKFKTILFNIPFGGVQLLAVMGGGLIATYIKKKGPVIIALCIIPIAGCVGLLKIHRTDATKNALLGSYYLVAFYPGITPLLLSWSSQNTAGDTKKKCTTGLVFLALAVGNIVGPQLYQPSDKPLYTTGLTANLVLFILIIVICALTMVYLTYLNRRHGELRVSRGKSAVIVDVSMQSSLRSGEAAELETEQGAQNIGEQAFDDLTDLQNEDFVFLL